MSDPRDIGGGPVSVENELVERQDLGAYCRQVADQAQGASRALAVCSTLLKNQWLDASAGRLLECSASILKANAVDVAAGPSFGLTDAQTDRLVLTEERLDGIANALREIAALPDPVGELISGGRRPSGLDIHKVRVPLGTVFFIYESRPNVTADAAAICVKSGNAVVLRGGKEARESSAAIVACLQSVAGDIGLPSHAVQLVETIDREAVGHFLQMDDAIDVAIPRGGRGLIERVSAEARMPVIKHFDGNCHVYVDASAACEMAVAIVENSKCQRMGVCNACESLLVHRGVSGDLLSGVLQRLDDRGIELRGDDWICERFPAAKKAAESDWGEEYLGPIISVKAVDSVGQAIEHINAYGSGHTDAIVASDIGVTQQFVAGVDSAAVIVNASTRFNDGGEFGLGAEIGISTDKFHARGPCGLRELTTYKYVVRGNGHIR
ncbi:MAG: glutamate-5-semialdehyde dehydrogenase [Pirellulaceae bacterium]